MLHRIQLDFGPLLCLNGAARLLPVSLGPPDLGVVLVQVSLVTLVKHGRNAHLVDRSAILLIAESFIDFNEGLRSQATLRVVISEVLIQFGNFVDYVQIVCFKNDRKLARQVVQGK